MKYEELSEEAKAKAREWWKDLEEQDWASGRAPDLYEDMAKCLSFLGIEVECDRETHYRTLNGKRHEWERIEWGFEWSGFYSQGDGLVFKGGWCADKVDMDALADYAPQDAVLAKLCAEFTALKLRYPQGKADIFTVNYGPGLPAQDVGDIGGLDPEDDQVFAPPEDADTLKALCRRAANWCYRQLEENYEYDTSDEAAAETITANGYEFDAEGAFSVGARVYA